ncbi:hypothetical protein [Amycolatopsis sp. NPDC004079]|uniref:hypothetical protein n=1 Tax=Amycolatopsis sp. NPDC004079 TaxID=3154549 RepID=UPI0033A2751C
MAIKISKTMVVGVATAALLPLGALAASAAPASPAAPSSPAALTPVTYTAENFEDTIPSLPLQLGGVAIGTGELRDANHLRVGVFYETCTVVTARRDQRLLCTVDLRFRDGDITGVVVEGQDLLVPGPTSREALGSITGGAGEGYNKLRGDLNFSGGASRGILNIVVNPV